MKNEDNGYRTSNSSTFLHTTDRRPFFYDIFYSIAVARIFSTTYAEREREKNAWSLFYLLPPHHLHPPPRPVSVQFSQRTVPVSFCGSPDPRPPPSHTRTFRGLIQRIHSKDDDVNWITSLAVDDTRRGAVAPHNPPLVLHLNLSFVGGPASRE